MRAVLLATLALLPAVAPAQTARIQSNGGEQAVRIGKAVVVRPFGAELVDRLSVIGSYRLGPRRVHLVRGDATGPCPSRFVFVTEQSGGQPIVTAPFGTCNGIARVQATGRTLAITMPDAAGAAPVRFEFDGQTVRQVTEAVTAADEAACLPSAYVDPASQDAAIAAFEADYPTALRSVGRAGKTPIALEELRTLVGTLACLAPWPAGEQRIPRLATPLFASRHSAEAFAALSAIDQDPASDAHLRASARSFAAEMTYRVHRREPL